ncbi:MAG: phosphoglycerate kinase [Candidatus Aenigmarchaeota archaeon]|nr:phosphoglycerate kinase [Candidatus Aenigmarchaeota archaeon]
MKNYRTIDDCDFKGKTTILRVDINSPVNKKGKVEVSDRSIEAAKTIRELSNKKAKLVVLAHQGRKGRDDFLPLKQHAKILTKYSKKKVKFIDDIIGKKAVKAVKSLKNGEIILLNNVRFLPDETEDKTPKQHSKSQLVRVLSPLADVFVNDAFSAAHRSHASMAGFTTILPSYIGRIMEKEIGSLEKIFTRMKISKHDTFILGGAKPEDPLEIMEHMLKAGTLEMVLVTGIVGNLFLIADGNNLGQKTVDFLEEKGYLKFLPQTKKIWKKYKKKIMIPMDLAEDFHSKRKEILVEDLPSKYQLMDIGTKTISKYTKIIKKSKNIVMKGPAGVYEDDKFAIGTKIILKAVKNSKGKSLIGGGHTLSALKKFRISKKGYDHVSLAGGALITYLSGKKLPALEALKKS